MISTTLKELRERRGLSRQQVADSLNIKKRALETYEYGNSEPNIELINKFADFYNVSADYLLGRDTGEPDTIDKLVGEFNMTALEKKILEGYLDLPEAMRGDLMEFLHKSVQEVQSENE